MPSNKIFVSVIVPCYNVESFISKCIESVLKQSYSNFELILIDDGSTDKTARLVDQFSNTDTRIMVIHKLNGGLSDARNAGIDAAKGDYLTFIDSDDYVDEKYIENLVKGITAGGDMSISQMLLVDEKGNPIATKKKWNQQISICDDEQAMKLILSQKFGHNAWGKLYPKSYFEKHEFPKNKYYEDLGIVYELVAQAEKVSFINSQDYFYVQRQNSIMQENFSLKKLEILEMGKKAEEFLNNNYSDLSPYIHSRLFSAYSGVWLEISPNTMYKESEEKLWRAMKEERKIVLQSLPVRKKAWIGCIVSIFGKRIFRKIGSSAN